MSWSPVKNVLENRRLIFHVVLYRHMRRPVEKEDLKNFTLREENDPINSPGVHHIVHYTTHTEPYII